MPPVRLDLDPPRSPAVERAIPLRRVALVQSEKELLHNPQFDLAMLPLRELGIVVETFTDSTLMALGGLDQFDAVVFGEDSIHESPSIAAWLDRQGTAPRNAVVLFQSRHEAYRPFVRDLELTPEAPQSEIVEIAADRGDGGEQLLEWPLRVDPNMGLARHEPRTKFSTVGTLDAAAWAVVLVVAQDGGPRPVLVRSLDAGDRRVICTCLLFPSREADRRLLCNAIVYAAFGTPAVTVVETPELRRGVALQKLVLHGARAVVVASRSDDPSSVDFASWPVVGSNTVVLARPLGEAGHAAEAWLRRGGIVLTAREREVRSLVGATDADHLAREWSAWFHAVDPLLWAGGLALDGREVKGKIYSSRAILRTLRQLRSVPGLADLLSLPDPEAFAARIEVGMRKRIDPGGRHVDGLVATTCALLEIDHLVGGAFDRRAVAGMEAWLLGQLASAVPLDAIDTARVLHRPDVLEEVQGSLHGTMAPEILARLRIARAELGIATPLADDVAADGTLQDNVLLASEVLLGWSLEMRGHAATEIAGRVGEVEQAVSILAKDGIRGLATADASAAETISAQVEARIAFDQLDPMPVRPIAAAGSEASGLLGAVLAESARVRTALDDTRQRLTTTDGQLAVARESVKVASMLLSGLWAAVCVGLGAAAAILVGAEALAISLPMAGVALVAGLGLLNRCGLAAPWVRELGSAMGDGVSGLLAWLGDRAGGLGRSGPAKPD